MVYIYRRNFNIISVSLHISQVTTDWATERLCLRYMWPADLYLSRMDIRDYILVSTLFRGAWRLLLVSSVHVLCILLLCNYGAQQRDLMVHAEIF